MQHAILRNQINASNRNIQEKIRREDTYILVERFLLSGNCLLRHHFASIPARAKMIASFNRGYRGFQQTYRSCTPAADTAIRRYLDEGAKIAREITARYTN